MTLGWTDEELRIWDLQYKSKPIKHINPATLLTKCQQAVVKISIVTGWAIPSEKIVQDVLIDELSKKLMEEYSSLNFDEFEYAIRSHGTKVKDWGKAINLTLIDQVLLMYIAARADVRRLEGAKIPPKQIEAKIEPYNAKNMIEHVRSTFLKTGLVGLILPDVYELLVQSGQINLSIEEKNKIFKVTEQRISMEAASEGLKAQKDLAHEKLNYPEKYKAKIQRECKKQSIANYFILQNQIENFL